MPLYTIIVAFSWKLRFDLIWARTEHLAPQISVCACVVCMCACDWYIQQTCRAFVSMIHCHKNIRISLISWWLYCVLGFENWVDKCVWIGIWMFCFALYVSHVGQFWQMIISAIVVKSKQMNLNQKNGLFSFLFRINWTESNGNDWVYCNSFVVWYFHFF